ncbi:MAG: hypothetical protein FWG88_01820 [Oscillospiraceae bacterium]|nr:hypothetical protein [Oscillospiraceae bacterium]
MQKVIDKAVDNWCEAGIIDTSVQDDTFCFETHPVIRLDMSRVSNKSPEVLESSILEHLSTMYSEEGFDMDMEVSVSRGRVDAVLELEDKVYVM